MFHLVWIFIIGVIVGPPLAILAINKGVGGDNLYY